MASDLGVTFLEGDSALPPYLKQRVQSFKPLTKADLEYFIEHLLFEEILIEVGYCGPGKLRDTIVAQALYRRHNRKRLKGQLEEYEIEVQYQLVKVSFLQNLRQLWSRPQGLRWVLYWLMNKPFFQAGD
jgi:hypothetical protein